MIEPIGVAYNGMFVASSGLKPGSHVVVYGAGPIGVAAVALVKPAAQPRSSASPAPKAASPSPVPTVQMSASIQRRGIRTRPCQTSSCGKPAVSVWR